MLSGQESKFLELLNAKRVELELPICNPFPTLMDIVEEHVLNMKKYGYCSHRYYYTNIEEYASFRDILELYGWGEKNYGECVSNCTNKGEELFERFKKSNGHWTILTYPTYNIIGIARAKDYWCIGMGRKS